MNNLAWSKLSCAVMLGLLLPLSVAQAAVANAVLQSSIEMTEDQATLTNSMTDYQATENTLSYGALLAAAGISLSLIHISEPTRPY